MNGCYFIAVPHWLILILSFKGKIFSNLNRLYLIVDLVVKRVIIANKRIFDKGLFRSLKA